MSGRSTLRVINVFTCSNMLHVHASEVAKLIGDNPFEKPDAALLGVLSRTARWRTVISKTRQEMGILTEQQVLDQVKPEVLQQSVLEACNAKSEADITKAVESAAQSNPQLSKPVIEAAIVKERGARLEQAVLNDYERKHDTTVDMRNSQRYQLISDVYVITGYIDGFDSAQNILIEVKNRRRHWRTVPVYDLTQMRVYLAMLKPEVTGKLVERFPDGSVRETSVSACPKEWERIHQALCGIVERFQALTEADVIGLVRS